MKRYLIISALVVVVFSGCTGDVGKFYVSTGAVGSNKKATAAFISANEYNWKGTVKSYVAGGFKILGWSNFSNLSGNERATAQRQAAKVHADLVIYVSKVLGSEIHAVPYTVMDSPGRTITATTNAYNSGSFNVYGDVNGYGTYSGNGYANTEIYEPPTFHTTVVPETFWRTGYLVVFLAKS
jgi:hypothetical protein